MELTNENGAGVDFDDYICGYIDGTLSRQERSTLNGYLKRNPEALEYFQKVVRGSRLLQGLPFRNASKSLESDLALNLNEEKMRHISG